MHAYVLALLGLLVEFVYSFVYEDVVCYKNWYFDTPRPAPRKCPPADFFSYFECCGDSDNCCRQIRVELLIFIFVPLSVVAMVLCCCTILAIIRSRNDNVDVDVSKTESRMSRDERECYYFY